MGGIKSLVKDTAVYGLSSIVGRFLNWLLVPIYTSIFAEAEYGVVTYVYSWVAIVLIILTYGMETGYFRFANHNRWTDPEEVYSTSVCSLGITSSIFILLAVVAAPALAAYGDSSESLMLKPSYISMMGIAVAVDAFTAIPFSRLRLRNRSMRFAAIKLTGIFVNIGLNLFFLLVCPRLASSQIVSQFYDPGFGIGYIFLANLISSLLTVLLLWREVCEAFPLKLNVKLLGEMLKYSFPLLILGIAGMLNQSLANILYPSLAPDSSTAMSELGAYGANFKIAIIMVMFTQAFRFAYEPFIFARSRGEAPDEDRRPTYALAMKYFIIFCLIIFLGVMFYLDIIKWFINPRYFSGLKIVPVVMIAEVCFGVFFNLSLWYKLTDRTLWGTWLSLMGLAVTLALNFLLVPHIGFMGCAIASLGCYATMMVASYLLGRKYYSIPYDLRSIGLYTLFAALLWGVSILISTDNALINYAERAILLSAFVFTVIRIEKIPLPNIKFRK